MSEKREIPLTREEQLVLENAHLKVALAKQQHDFAMSNLQGVFAKIAEKHKIADSTISLSPDGTKFIIEPIEEKAVGMGGNGDLPAAVAERLASSTAKVVE